ncbi:MAG: low molecular weight phosphotyrosine protein phosphatase [Clostridia bacterium]|nr:low molecular weight phosphotyrosine protein phosphatase [Clostridia bacterium]
MKVLFVCHGNICRSPMAEMILKHMIRQRRLKGYTIDSAAVSREEIGNPVYPPVRRELATHGVRCEDHRARQMTAADYNQWDYLIGMDTSNITRMLRILGGDPQGKVHRLLDFTSRPGDVADPWYTDRFDTCYRDIWEGCEALLRFLEEK